MADERDRVELLTDREVAERYKVSERTVREWRHVGAVKTVHTPGGRPRTEYHSRHGLDPWPKG